MTDAVAIVDLFSGPGGLAEGFSAYRSEDGRYVYRVALSIEMEVAAHRTLRLRAFLRNFLPKLPSEYYDFLNGEVNEEPNWAQLYPNIWAKTCNETPRMELGREENRLRLRERLKKIRSEYGGSTILLGGPPCQSYSLVGRARNAGNKAYDPDLDARQSLYKEYVHALKHLRPAIAILENVKGLLSARHEGNRIFPDLMRALERGGGADQYRLFALSSRSGAGSWDTGAHPADFLVRAEEHGIPQRRHRVFVACIRQDISRVLPEGLVPRLERCLDTVALHKVIGGMPRLRSRLSKGDCAGAWQSAIRSAYMLVKENRPPMSPDVEKRFSRALHRARVTADGDVPEFRNTTGGTGLPPDCPSELGEWFVDERVKTLPNNETKAHISSDLARYLFAAAYGYAFRRSPKARDFPPALAPAHTNWNTGKFNDRFRVQLCDLPSTTVTSHLAKDGHYFIHPDPGQIRSLTVREAARLQTFPDNYFFHGNRTQQYVQVGNAVPPFLAWKIAGLMWKVLDGDGRERRRPANHKSMRPVSIRARSNRELPAVTTAVR